MTMGCFYEMHSCHFVRPLISVHPGYSYNRFRKVHEGSFAYHYSWRYAERLSPVAVLNAFSLFLLHQSLFPAHPVFSEKPLVHLTDCCIHLVTSGRAGSIF